MVWGELRMGMVEARVSFEGADIVEGEEEEERFSLL